MPRRRADGGKMSSKEILPLQDPWNDAWRATEQLARNRFPGYGDLPVGTPPVRQWPYVRGTRLNRDPNLAGCLLCQLPCPECAGQRVCMRPVCPFIGPHNGHRCHQCQFIVPVVDGCSAPK